jgi:hypothetical protein
MHEGIDRFQLALGRRSVESDDDAGDGARSEADANEMAGQKLEFVGDEVAERARWSAHAREDRDLRGPERHKS